MKTICRLCQSTTLETVLCTHGPHYARRVCENGHFVDWVPRPREAQSTIPEMLKAFTAPRRCPAPLRGSDRQCAAARAVRYNAIGFAEKAGEPEFARLLASIADATWFLANKGLFPPDLKCWPRVDQMDDASIKEVVKP